MSLCIVSLSRNVFNHGNKLVASNKAMLCMEHMKASLGTSSSCFALDQKYRRKHKLPVNPNSNTVLHERPDFSYLDGRPAPFGLNQLKKMVQQQEIAQKVVQLNAELNFAVERHKNAELLKEEKRNEILSKKLKPKGRALLKDSS